MRSRNKVYYVAKDNEGVDICKIYNNTNCVTIIKLLLNNTVYA
jgi:hypothetical protein